MAEEASATQCAVPPPFAWRRPVEFPVNDRHADPDADPDVATTSDTASNGRVSSDAAAGTSTVSDIVLRLNAALRDVRDLFDHVMSDAADQRVSATELAEVLAQSNQLERAANAVTIAATAGYARREDHPHPEDISVPVTSIRARGYVHEWAPNELGHLLRLSTRTAGTRVELAASLTSRMPRTLEAVRDGAIEAWQASKAVDLLLEAGADDQVAREVDDFIGPRLATTDPSRILALTRYALGRVAPELLPDRAAQARPTRKLEKWEVEPGLTEVVARMPSEHAAAIWAAATELAKQYLKDDPALSMDQARLDAFVDLALANVTVKASVTLGIPVVTSAYARTGEAPVDPRDPEAPPPGEESAREHDARHTDAPPGATHGRTAPGPADATVQGWGVPDDGYRGPGDAPHGVPEWAAHPDAASASFTPPPSCAPGERQWWLSGTHLPGIGYIPPDVVQALVSALGVTISTALLDAQRGTLLGHIHDGYRPPTALRDLVTSRDGRCRAFGCSMPAVRCDLDHATAYDCEQARGGDGPTCGENLAALCRRHHRAKQRREWCYVLDPATSVVWWVNARTGAMRTTVPDISIGTLDPPLTRGAWDPPSPPERLDDRDLVNIILGKATASMAPDFDATPVVTVTDTGPATRAYTAAEPIPPPPADTRAVPAQPMSPGDCLSPAHTLDRRRKRICDPTDPIPF